MLGYVVTIHVVAMKAVVTVGPFKTAREAKAWTKEVLNEDDTIATAVTRTLWKPIEAEKFLKSQSIKAS